MFPSEILWYKQLFFNGHHLLMSHELQSVSIEDGVKLVDFESENFSEKQISIFFDAIRDNSIDIFSCRGALKDLLDQSHDYLKDKDLIPYYIGFMHLYSIIIPEYEVSIMDYIKEIREKIEDGVIDDTELLEGLISSYKEIITVCSEKLSDQTLHNISVIDSYIGYNKNVANQLFDRSFVYEYVLVMLNLDNLIDFTDIRIHNSIEEHYNDIKQREVEFKKLRMEVLGTSENTIESYLFLFGNENSTMTQEELKVLSDNIDDCERWVMRLIPSEELTEDNYLWVAEFFNGKEHDCNESVEILKYVLSSEDDIAERMFYSLDFNRIKYRSLKSTQKSIVIELGKERLILSNTSGKLRFMESTRYLDEKFEIEILEEVRTDKALQEQYVRIVKHIGKLPKHSAHFLNELDRYYSFNDGINRVFLECGYYLYYIVSDTNSHLFFKMAQGDMLTTLWPYYIEVFSSTSFENARRKMTKNTDFLELVMKKEEYIGFIPENRMQLCDISQDAKSIRNVFENYDNDFAIRYFIHMEGFADQNAAQEFIDLIRNYKEVLLSNEVYNKIYPLLNDKKLKRKYTNMRKHLNSEK